MFEYTSSPGSPAYKTEENNIVNGLRQLQFTDPEIQAVLQVKHGFEQWIYGKRAALYAKGKEYPFKDTDLRKYIKYVLQSNPKGAERVIYAYDLILNKKSVSNTQELQKHLKKMEGHVHKIDISDLPMSTVTRCDKYAIAYGINEAPFDVWNYDKCRKLLKVVEHSSNSITVQTPIKPVIQYRGSFELPGKVKIAKGLTGKDNSECVVTFSTKHCVLCNTYVIVASTRNPETNARNNLHLGGYKLICYEGTALYVYVMDIGQKDKPSSLSGDRVYDYGIDPKEIAPRLNRVTKKLYNDLQCKYSEPMKPKKNFVPFTDPRKANAIERAQLEEGIV